MPMPKMNDLRRWLRASGGRSEAIGLTAAVEIQAAAEPKEGESPKRPRFSINAYNGGVMSVSAFYTPVVVDLKGLKASRKKLPILLDHDSGRIIGQADDIKITAEGVTLGGIITGDDGDAQKVVAHAKNGFEWQASIGATVERREFLEQGKTATVNGREVTGPLIIARAATLRETSFTAIGADSTTSARVAAHQKAKELDMDFAQWLTANGWNPDDLSDKQRDQLQAAWKAEGNNKPTPQVQNDTVDPAAEIRAKAAAEAGRIAAIRDICAKNGSPKVKAGEVEVYLEAHAIAEGWDATKVELEAIRASRPQAPAFNSSRPSASADVLEAATCLAGGLETPEKFFEEKTLEAADKQFRGRIGLQELMLEAARMNGYTGHRFRGSEREVFAHAFGGIQASGFSTISLSGILSNTANKFILAGFNSIESTWRQIAAIRPVSDFKQITSYRLTGDMEYEQIGPDGEIKHGTVGEQSFTNQAKTYGKMFSLTRTDIVNDDLGALAGIRTKIGRGAGLKLNKVFWGEFLDDSTFFTGGNGNLKTGTSSALGVDSLTTAEQAFLDQTDPDGDPLGIAPSILLVPNALNVTATQLAKDTEIRDTTASKKYTTGNPHAGKFTVVRSSYLSNTNLTGNSTTGWYLLADPMDLPVIEVAFLNGRQVPTVEQADADFNVLGIQMRGYHDFGVSKQEHRAGVKSTGTS